MHLALSPVYLLAFFVGFGALLIAAVLIVLVARRNASGQSKGQSRSTSSANGGGAEGFLFSSAGAD